ncbi:UvrD-helicase domain-containing protein [Rhodoferax sp.]|uniref:UvrD-helicase domain-containing protein n=1 Tax=Rhodoferax sp. TaxID=50421 RepID=UPI00284014BF|nr:UvrD-helicase domain-containing protein [Rhodoferax sp.]MDR3370893.1 UvrD-helicase domain-containing protein [Rhodoferax sp.]
MISQDNANAAPPQTPAQHTLNPLTLPLSGLQLIEASAGTGKTWTLAALYVRLVLGHAADSDRLGAGLYPPQILVMTFTEAATAELRERIRERLALSARFFQSGDAPQVDDFLRDLRASIAPDDWPQCAQRLDMAAQWMDDAAIFTIHGWSSRMLKTHAFDSASLFTQNRVEDGERLQLVATQDYWRHWFYGLDASALAALKAVGDTPQALLDKLKTLWRESERAPQADAPAPASPDILLARWATWQQQRQLLETPARAGWTAQVTQAISDVAAAKTLKNYRPDWLTGWLAQMADWAQGGDIDPVTLERFTTATLLAKGWAAAEQWPVFEQLQSLHAHLANEPDVATDLLANAATEVHRAYQRAKAQAAQFDFSDLLQNLYRALQAPDGRLASAIRAQYPVALVDEFQDTDPWQFGSLNKIYSYLPNEYGGYSLFSSINSQEDATSEAQAEGGLIMIGDPKQAIYSFRGADLATYLRAREQAQGIYNLPGNYRSTPGVVAAVNQVFSSASAPFGSVPFVPVAACNALVKPLQVAGQPQVAMTVWHLPFDKTPNKNDFLSQMAAVFASQMVSLLQSGAAQSGDMAVLVRDWREADAIRQALSQRGVRSVYLSERNSVYASQQAQNLWRILRAVASPGSNRLVRAALATPTWGLGWRALDALFADEAAWDALVEQFLQWQRVWRTQGFLPMLYRLLHDQGLAARLLQDPAQGERALTNLLHLGELLQASSLELQGEGALIRHLEEQLRRPQASGEAAQLRLESDANLVQVVTLHKSKGLEYPLVFLPFVSLFRAEDKESARPDEERLSEDIRLLYVALTRAKQALWLGVAQVKGDVDGKTPKPKSALSSLLGRSAPDDLWRKLQNWACDDIAVQTAPEPTDAIYQPSAEVKATQAALLPQRLIQSRWWSASFSALTRDLAHGTAATGAQTLPSERDERLLDAQTDNVLADDDLGLTDASPTPQRAGQAAADLLTVAPPFNDFPAGSRYGTLLHDLLEWQATHGWPAAMEPTATAPIGVADQLPSPQPAPGLDAGDTARSVNSAPVGAQAGLQLQWQTLLTRQSQRHHLSAAHSAMLDGWVRQLITSKLPLAQVNQGQAAIQLGALKAPDMWPEMGFSLPVHSLGSQALDALISQHIWPTQPREPLQRRQLQGMLTGFMDLVLLHEGRYYVLDYKSNRLAAYLPAQLQQAMLAHRYDVQAALYVLALHRLLKSRLPGYDPAVHLGGALYLFLRGADQPGGGLLHLSLPSGLVEALDVALASTLTREATT